MRPLAVVIATGLVVAACSGGDDDEGTDAALSVTDATPAALESVAPVLATTVGADLAPATTTGVADTTRATTTGVAAVCAPGEFPSAGAFDIARGAVLWSKSSAVGAYREVLGAAARVVVISESSTDGESAIALDAADGTELWRHPVFQQIDPPGVVDDAVVVIESASETPPFVAGLDARTGEELWRRPSGTSVIAATPEIVVTAGAAPGGGIVGLDRATGEELWSNAATFEGSSGVGGAGAVSDGIVLVTTSGPVTGIDIATGETLWTAERLETPVASDGVFAGAVTSDRPPGEIRAIAADGTTSWTLPGRASYGGIIAVGDGVAVVNDATGIGYLAYELTTGDERWRTGQAQMTAQVEPQLIVGTSLVLLWEGELQVASTTDGSRVWASTQPLNSPWMNSVGANDTTVFVAVNSVPFGD
jgi:outer membrane protein assembly factor BamB